MKEDVVQNQMQFLTGGQGQRERDRDSEREIERERERALKWVNRGLGPFKELKGLGRL